MGSECRVSSSSRTLTPILPHNLIFDNLFQQRIKARSRLVVCNGEDENRFSTFSCVHVEHGETTTENPIGPSKMIQSSLGFFTAI